MISETSTIIVIHPKSKTIKKKIFLTLKRETKFEDFKSEIIK